MKLLLVFAAIASVAVVVDAGFCDYKTFSGSYCDGTTTSKYCSCKYKKKKLKCDKSYERRCAYGCNKGSCSLPPIPKAADKTCSKTKVGAPYNVVCPALNNYTLWKNYADTPALLTELDAQTKDDKLWWLALRLRMIEIDSDKLNETNTTGMPSLDFCDVPNATCVNEFLTTFPDVSNSWTSNKCDAASLDYTCRWGFPECKSDKGVVSACQKSCQQMDVCLAGAVTACEKANNDTFQGVLVCKKYADTITEDEKKKYLTPDGKRNCVKFCKENQNDFVPDGASTLSSSLWLALVPAFVAYLLQARCVWVLCLCVLIQ